MSLKRKIRVAFFADILTRDYDGAIKTMYQLIDHIPEDKFEFMFFTGSSPIGTFKHKVFEIPTLILPFNSNYTASLPVLCQANMTKALNHFKPDIIHIATPSPLGFWGLSYAKRNRIPVLTIYHTDFLSYVKHYFNRAPLLIRPIESIVKLIYWNFYNFCQLVYVPTSPMIDELKACGVSARNMKLRQRGIDGAIFNPSKKDPEFIQQLIGNNKPCLLFASRLVWEKNLKTLFRIYDEVEAQQLNVNFLVAGSGVAEADARKRMKNAIFLGYLDHETLSKVYAASDIFVFPSVSETFGNVVVEAMACGCVPVIARGGGTQSLVRNSENGFLCDPDDANEYAQKIELLLTNAVVRRTMQLNGIHFASTMKWDHLVNEYFFDLEMLFSSHLPFSDAQEVVLTTEMYPAN